jgi:VanZ family protein
VTDAARSARRAYLVLALGTIAFTVYGSYVPFHFRARPFREACSTFLWTMQTRTAIESRSDGFANWMLGVPLGFALMGALRAGRSNGIAAALIGGWLVPLCAAFAAAVEFGQLFFPGRTCSGTDVVAQALGALSGVLAWILLGPWLTGKLRAAFAGAEAPNRGVQFLAGYAAFVTVVQWLPFDFSISPYDIHRWMKRDYLKVSYVPFEELRNAAWRDGATLWDKARDWLELALLFLPLGLLAGGVPWFRGWWRLPVAAFAFAFLTEAGQITVSRHPSSADVIVAAFAVLFGRGIAALAATRWIRARRWDAACFLAQTWLIAMIPIHWQPFRWTSNPLEFRKDDWVWWPLPAQVSENYLRSLDTVLTKFVLYAPLGILVAWAGAWAAGPSAARRAALLGGVVAAVLEVGQSSLAGRIGSPSDILFGILGGWLGAALAGRAVGEGASHGNR